MRFAASNEVATLSNGSIANARITNCAKSKNAIVLLDVKLHIKVHQGQNLDRFRDALENYVLDNPNVWASIKFFRCIEIDTDNEYVIYRICMDSTVSSGYS